MTDQELRDLATKAARILFALWPLVISGMVTALGWALWRAWT